MTVIDLKQRHNAWKALEAPSVEPILLEKFWQRMAAAG